MIEAVEGPDVVFTIFFDNLYMIIFVVTVTTATLTVAVIEVGFGDREREQVALPIAPWL